MTRITKPSLQLLRQIRQSSEEKLPDSKNEKLSFQETDREELEEENVGQQQKKVDDETWAKKEFRRLKEKLKL